MGWSSASYIFDPVAQAIVDGKDTEEVLTILINELLMGDWDTWGESVADFRNYPVIINAFRKSELGAEEVDETVQEMRDYFNE